MIKINYPFLKLSEKNFNRYGLLCFAALLLSVQSVSAQHSREDAIINIKKSGTTINVDGVLDEEAWQIADKAGDFYQNFPTDSLPATADTEVMLTFDDNYLYIAAVCYAQDDKYIVASLKRDYVPFNTESFNVYIDPYNDLTNGFTFGLSPLGIQREGLFSERRRVSSDWDNKWFSEVTNYPDKWVLEMAIPFKTLRYSEDNKTWNINFLRFDLKNNERTTWAKVPRQFRPNNILYAGKLLWESPPPKTGPNISVIPYVSSRVTKNHEEGENTDYNLEAGFDAKIGITPSLNLDLTVNPDFSQVEVDEQVTNLDRFELFFPEKRQFFLENSDLFSQAGVPPARPFFSRRIGIARDTADNIVQIPIVFGARLSGNLDQNWRVGLLNMQTASDGDLGILGQNYTVTTFNRRVFSGSTIGGIFVNRQAVNFDDREANYEGTKYNRVFGLDYNLVSKNNKWSGDIFYHRSVDPGNNDKSFAHGGFLSYTARNIRAFWFHNYVGENYNAEVGFVRRTGFARGFLGIEPIFFPKSDKIVTIQPEFRTGYTTDIDFNVLDREYSAEVGINFTNTSELQIEVENNSVILTDSFDPTNTDGPELEAGKEYNWTRFGIGYESDGRKVFNYELSSSIGGFFNGNRIEFQAQVNYRYQPYGNFSMNFSYNKIDLPEPFNDADFILIGPRIDLTFTDKIFFTTFIQYNDQRDNLNINSRIQWRYKPVSDFFIVYTDNYFPGNFRVKNRALVLKLSYWLNV
ncbi:DUF5916 domain-containing protein [Fulvivirgaceae bacterium BMA10]|uniref:DUF5916 domain-containing protein n=1 Tax=Splendidivirga corallicola TaxID=3051826 RepID=A0ABT8KJT5_9BACT|nr:DUF5916 domain-containing protein [Fulvivirgaceae bacterium BMA10]